VDRKKLQPESADKNFNKRDFVEKDGVSVPNSLDNLYDVLNELVTQEKPSESTLVESDRLDIQSFQEAEKPEFKLKSLNSQQFSENAFNSSLKEMNSVAGLSENDQKLENNLIEAEIIETKINLTPSELNTNDSTSLSKINSQIPQLDLDSFNAEEVAKTYISQEWIIEKEKKLNELANYIDTLLPLVVELSKTQANTSQDHILKAIVPIIDRVIKQRTAEDSEIMADAIANLLPDAIQQEIKNRPEAIGKAIAPEVALSIKEQIKLDENAIAQALGSEMGKAIKTQIAMERDAMVDALYPVIGSTISKYMAEVVQSINEKVDSALSPIGIQRKIRAKLQGVSEAELILKESYPFSIRAIFLIHKTSGLVIRELQPNQEVLLESDLLAGMLTAIRSFANDCIVANAELDQIDYDNFQILFETAGYCYLAVVVNGEPIRQFRDRMRAIFSKIIISYGEEIAEYQGNPATIPNSLQFLLEELVRESTKPDYNKPPKALYWLITLLLTSILLPLGILKYRSVVAHHIEEKVAVELDRTPELSVYRITPQVQKQELTLKGRVSSAYLRDLAATVTKEVATENNLSVNNQIIAVNVPVDPTVTTQEVARITKALNQNSPVLIDTTYQDKTVTINGLILDETERNNLLTTFTSIPGVEKVVFLIQQQLPTLNTRIYFAFGSAEFSLTTNSAKMTEIKQFLNKYPLIKLKIIGHSDRQGAQTVNVQLAQARAKNVYQALIAQGVAPERLEIMSNLQSPPDLVVPNQPDWMSRCVQFESFIAESENNREVNNVSNFQKNLPNR
jgi:outer membrane protein OmpA-like peptidoglycan-associated protein